MCLGNALTEILHYSSSFFSVYTQSSPANRCSETSQFIASKSSLSSEMRDKFNETAEEAVLCLQDTLENTAK